MKCFATLIGVMAMSSAVLAADLDSDSHKKTAGSTRSEGAYRIFEDGDKVKVELSIAVKNSGANGSGKGVMAFALADGDGKTLFSKVKGTAVGTSASGNHERKQRETLTLPGDAAKRLKEDGGIVAFTVQTDADTTGIPKDLNEWKQSVTDIAELRKGLKIGQSKEVKDWSIKRIIK